MILDTDVLIDVLRRHPPALEWFSGIADKPTTTGFCAMEVVSGCRDSADVRRAELFLADLDVLWPPEDDLHRALTDYASLRLSSGLGVLDALIATTAIGLDMPLATFNVRHFSSIPGLTLVQPYER